MPSEISGNNCKIPDAAKSSCAIQRHHEQSQVPRPSGKAASGLNPISSSARRRIIPFA
jgi:hypothetical protein